MRLNDSARVTILVYWMYEYSEVVLLSVNITLYVCVCS